MGDLADYLTSNDPSFRKARLPALYSDFRSQRTLNPDGYTANLSAWRAALARLAWDAQLPDPATSTTPPRLLLTVDDALPAHLQSRQFGRPLALGTVVREALDGGDLVPVPDFLARKESIYAKTAGWGAVPWSVASWAARQLGFGNGGGGTSAAEDKMPKGTYVVLPNLEKAGGLVAEQAAARASDTRFERTFTRRHFERACAADLAVAGQKDRALPRRDVDVLLRFLARDKGLVASDGQTVRIRVEGEDAAITEEDAAVAQLKALVEDLKHQTTLLAARVDTLAADAKAAVGRRNNAAAMRLLREKKTAEATLGKRGAALLQMEEIAARIQQARDQVQFVKVMEGSAGVLKQLNAEVGGVERVEGVVDALREQMADTDEVGRILASAGEVEAIDDGEIDDELRALEKAEEDRIAAEKQAEKDAHQAREAEATRKRLEEAGSVPETEAESEAAAKTAEQLERMSLDERPQPQAAS
ncbi:hypothetical protein D7B24_007209 [Verticillium nonalfalfae]|uniref:Charged multivesicular body protein 7 n=1 Tax=Verticillium nonalfalfae TaxID=1051616 RepID=A0A3M9Y7M3_9PEZI|nr:uncharacterized protein D7B24_007209 [Verticillium nonalfalfae]RNJ56489.1 hypothetical protein D7B24_007209 [Verticillium nonalfalfae]